MHRQIKHFYEFGPFRLDVGERILMCEDRIVALTPKAFETLLALVENSGRIVEKDFLMKQIWPNTFVEEVSLARNVSALRKALGEIDGVNQYIETFPKRGYRFVAAVSEHKDDPAVTLLEDYPEQAIGFGELSVEMSKETALEVPASPENPTSGETLIFRITRRKSAAIIGAVMLVIGIAVTAYMLKSQGRPTVPLEEMKFTRLTNTGKSTDGVISPDARYVAYVNNDNRKYSLWIKHIATNSEVQLAPSTEGNYSGLTFSRDENYIYYVKTENDGGVLYRSPVLGGAAIKLIEGIVSPITFSQDGNRFAFIRTNKETPGARERSLVIANTDGTGEQTLATRAHPEFFGSGLAWSPTGKTIACIVTSPTGGQHAKIIEVRLEDGTEKQFTQRKWADIGRVAWFADGRHLVMTAQDQASSPSQIWLLSYPEGKEKRVTNDLADYRGVSLSADSRTMVTRQFNLFLNVWTAPDSDASRAIQITTGEGAAERLSWTPDGRIVFSTHSSGNQNIWIMEANGEGRKKLAGDSHINTAPCVSRDGRYIFFASDRLEGTTHMWRMDIDGNNQKQMTFGVEENSPFLSPDGLWVYYHVESSAGKGFWRVSTDGGEPVPLPYELPNMAPNPVAISPDGKHLACFYKETPSDTASGIAILPIEGGKPLKKLPALPTRSGIAIRWMPDSQSIAYISTAGGVSNVWTQPLDGGEPRQLTNFNSERIFYFDWSRDGKQFACVRGYSTSDIVLISNFR
ncbi:MAG: winged helix-turn-helix domain-containing protein [Blastocatellia bacterium]